MAYVVRWDFPTMDIPKEFFSEKTKRPFSNCNMCGHTFVEFDSYVVEKSFKRGISDKKAELVYEYAICEDCMINIKTELSEKSIKNIDMYYKLYVDFKERAKNLLESDDKNIENWIANCIITGKPILQEEEYSIGCYIYNNQLVLDTMPLALGKKAIYEMQEVLSKKTKDILDGFQNEILPPEIREKLPDGRLILL